MWLVINGIITLIFRRAHRRNLDWTLVIFAGAYQLTPTATKLYGVPAIQVVLNINNCCVLRALWLHRNNKLYNTEKTNSVGFVCNHARAYIQLHFRKLAEIALRN
ncbi:hypothetical protein Plhal304r1_c023g0078801 [Plasmopara halstedii]